MRPLIFWGLKSVHFKTEQLCLLIYLSCPIFLCILMWLYGASHNRIPNWFQWGYRGTGQWRGVEMHKVLRKICLPIGADTWSCLWEPVRALLSGSNSKLTGPK